MTKQPQLIDEEPTLGDSSGHSTTPEGYEQPQPVRPASPGLVAEPGLAPTAAHRLAPGSIDIRLESVLADSYVRTRHNNLRCFPKCSPFHMEQRFCGRALELTVAGVDATLVPQMLVFAEFRNRRSPSLFEIGITCTKQRLSDLSDRIMMAEFVREMGGILRFVIHPPRKWHYPGKIRAVDWHVLQTYIVLVDRLEATHVSSPFHVTPIWKNEESAKSRDAKGEANVEEDEGDDNDEASVDGMSNKPLGDASDDSPPSKTVKVNSSSPPRIRPFLPRSTSQQGAASAPAGATSLSRESPRGRPSGVEALSSASFTSQQIAAMAANSSGGANIQAFQSMYDPSGWSMLSMHGPVAHQGYPGAFPHQRYPLQMFDSPGAPPNPQLQQQQQVFGSMQPQQMVFRPSPTTTMAASAPSSQQQFDYLLNFQQQQIEQLMFQRHSGLHGGLPGALLQGSGMQHAAQTSLNPTPMHHQLPQRSVPAVPPFQVMPPASQMPSSSSFHQASNQHNLGHQQFASRSGTGFASQMPLWGPVQGNGLMALGFPGSHASPRAPPRF